MQGGEEREAEHQSDIRMENTEEPTLLTETQENVIEENVIDMQEKGAGVKRGQSEHAENLVNGKLRRREGIKRGLRDIDRVSYEEYDNSWDLEDQSKRCKRAVNCLLVSSGCKRETAMIEPIRREQGDDVSTVEIPGPSSNSVGRYSDTSAGFSAGRLAASSNATSDCIILLVSHQGIQGVGTDHGVALCIIWG